MRSEQAQPVVRTSRAHVGSHAMALIRDILLPDEHGTVACPRRTAAYVDRSRALYGQAPPLDPSPTSRAISRLRPVHRMGREGPVLPRGDVNGGAPGGSVGW